MLPEGTNRPSAVCLNGMVDCCVTLRREFSEIPQKPKTSSRICSYSYIGSPRSLTAQRVLHVHGLCKWHITERFRGVGFWSLASSTLIGKLKAFLNKWSLLRPPRTIIPQRRCWGVMD